MNRLYQGDNLAILRDHIPATSVDLVYLDPPFKTGAKFGSDGRRGARAGLAFDDRWPWDQAAQSAYAELTAPDSPLADGFRAFHSLLGPAQMLAYLTALAPRLQQIRRVLAPSGNVYLHCDPAVSHYLKVVMDLIFGPTSYRNEVIWAYAGRGAKATARHFPRNHDVILVYAAQPDSPAYNRQYISRRYTLEEARAQGFRQDGDGRWFKTAPRGDYTDRSLERLEAEGRIYRTASGAVRVKYFLGQEDGHVTEEVMVGDTWTDIADAMHLGSERTGYPTQKPEKLLERIIRAGSGEGATVLDPYCGSGTTLVAAERLGRRWIGIDRSLQAVEVSRARLSDAEYELVEL